MKYYTKSEELPTDKEATKFLFKSSLVNWLLGSFWLLRYSGDDYEDIISDAPDIGSARNTVCKLIVLKGDQELFDYYLENSNSMSHPRFSTREYRQLMSNGIDDRVEGLTSTTTSVEYNGWDIETNAAERNDLDCSALIPEISQRWLECEDDGINQKMKYCLRNLEVFIGADLFSK